MQIRWGLWSIKISICLREQTQYCPYVAEPSVCSNSGGHYCDQSKSENLGTDLDAHASVNFVNCEYLCEFVNIYLARRRGGARGVRKNPLGRSICQCNCKSLLYETE